MNPEKRRIKHDGDDESTFNRLPHELWLQILSLLPSKTLLRLRTLRKSYLSAIDDPSFLSLHLHNFPHNATETRFLTTPLNSNGTLHQVCDTVTQSFIENIDSPQLQTGKELGQWCLAGSLHGLLLLISTVYTDSRRTLLWNPSIRKLRNLCLPMTYTRHVGLGYDAGRQDYAVIAMNGYGYESRAWVYRVKTGIWNEIPNSGFARNFGKKTRYTQSLSYEGGVAWVEYSESTKLSMETGLTLFDFGTEKFRYKRMPYPASSKGRRDGCRLVMLDGGSSIGVWGVYEDKEMGIWWLEMETMKWSLRYKMGGRMMPVWTGQERVRFVEEEGVLVMKYWTRNRRSVVVVSYDSRKGEMGRKCEVVTGVEDCLGVYFESLVMLKDAPVARQIEDVPRHFARSLEEDYAYL